MPGFSAADGLALVECSPAAVAAHDRDAWLSLFARYNIVEDPVGSRPHLSGVYDAAEGRRGNGPLQRFYDTFIAPNQIEFRVDRDLVSPLLVVRDLTIEITMAPGVVVRTPMHLRYELAVEGGELRIARLAAHWEMWPAMKQQLGHGMASLRVGLRTGMLMTRNLGVGGTLAFLGALRSVGGRGKRRVMRLAEAVNTGFQDGHDGLLSADATCTGLGGSGLAPAATSLAAAGGTLTLRKLIAAGNFVSATVAHTAGEATREGVVFFEFDRRRMEIVTIEFCW